MRSGVFGQLTALRMARENRPVLAALVLAFAFLVWKARHLVYPDLAFTYPFITFDGFQWILDADLYAGKDVSAAYRNPGLPLVIALLGKLGATRYLPLLTTALLGVFFVYLTLLLIGEKYRPWTVSLVVLLLFFNYTVQTTFDFVLADQWALTLQLLAIYHLRRSKEDLRHVFLFVLWAAISFHFQYAIAWLTPAFLYYWFVEVRPAARLRSAADRAGLAALALGLLLVAPPFVYKWKQFGNPLFSHVTQFPLVRLHFFGTPYYAVNLLAYFGVPAALTAAYGFFKSAGKRGFPGFMNLCFLCWAGFWVFLYSWLDSRFILYALPFVAFALAEGLERIDVPSLVSFRTQALPRVLLGCALVPLALLYSLYERGSPFAAHRLPVSPQNVLVFGVVPITNWEANVTIDVANWKLENVTDRIPAWTFLRRYYPEHRRAVPPAAIEELEELRRLRAAAERELGGNYRVARCGSLPDDYYSRMRREIVLDRRLRECGEAAEARLYASADPMAGESVIFAGRTYRLARADRDARAR